MAASFIRPIAGANVPISDDFNEHKARGSVNPGTDYAVARGTPVRMPADGILKWVDTGLSGAAGRSLVVYFDNGWSGDLLHLSGFAAGMTQGKWVAQGTIIAFTGASANGSESGVGAHLHFTLRTKQVTSYSNQGNVDPELHYTAILSGTQRQVKPEGPMVLRRVTPDRTQADIDPDLMPGEIGNFNGWIRGENVANNAVWFRGISGNWFWSGGFTSSDTAGLEDLNPKPPTVLNKRKVLDSSAANTRSAAHRGAAVVGSFPAGSEQEFAFWTIGEAVTANGVTTDLWYVTADQKQFTWSGGYTTQDKLGLTELPHAPIPPATWPADSYSFAAAGDFVTRVVPAHWSNFENQYSVPNPAERKGFPALPTSIVDHQWNAPGVGTINSVINTFTGRHDNPGDRVSAHFVIDADQIVQMVSLSDRAYHAGAHGNDFVGLEIDPYISEVDANGELTERAKKIIANVRKVHLFLGKRNANLALMNRLHRTIAGASTSCGQYIEPVLPLLDVQSELTPPPDPEPEPTPSDDELEAFIDANIKFLIDYRDGMK